MLKGLWFQWCLAVWRSARSPSWPRQELCAQSTLPVGSPTGRSLRRRGSVPPGRGDLLPGVEPAVLGMTAGLAKTVTMPVAHADGPHQPARPGDRAAPPVPGPPPRGGPAAAHAAARRGTTGGGGDSADGGAQHARGHPLAGHALHCDLTLVAMLYKRSGQSAGSGPRTLWPPMCPQPLGHCGALVHAAPWRSCAAG